MNLNRIRHKYRAEVTRSKGIRFDSRREAKYYDELLLRVQAGEVLFFLRQVPLHLPGNVIYRIDFVEFWANGDIYWIDVKGYETESFKAKKRMVEDLYPITIEVR